MTVRLAPITQVAAKAFVREHHRHSRPPVGCITQTSVRSGGELVGVAILGRPVARGNQDGWTAEVLRVCVVAGAGRNVCTMLYGAVKRIAAALGYRRLVTYTLVSEGGTSVKAAGFERIRLVKGREWDTPSRPRLPGFHVEDRFLWDVRLTAKAAT